MPSTRRGLFDVARFEPMERSAWAWMPLAALLLFWVELTTCSAQPPNAASGTAPRTGTVVPGLGARSPQPALPTPSPSLPSQPRVASDPAAVGEVRDLPPALPPTTGSPSIRRRSPAQSTNPLATDLNLKAAPLEPS